MNRKGFIVIQEDDDLIRELLERWLGEAGYAIGIACGQELRLPSAERPCLVIADVPSPRGAQAQIQSLQQVYAAPILILSARFRRGLAGSAETALRLGVKKVLPKPFTRKELLSAVDESLESAA